MCDYMSGHLLHSFFNISFGKFHRMFIHLSFTCNTVEFCPLVYILLILRFCQIVEVDVLYTYLIKYCYGTILLNSDEYWQNHPELHDVPIYYASQLAKKCMSGKSTLKYSIVYTTLVLYIYH